MILEGLTGTGKSSVLRALARGAAHTYDMFDEEVTFGEFFAELVAHPERPDFSRLHATLAEVERRAAAGAAYRFVLERFHPSYYALYPDRAAYAAIDRRAAALGTAIVLLDLPDALLRERSLYRADRPEHAEALLRLYGDETRALEALRRSRDARRAYVRASACPHVILDTGDRAWARCADAVGALLGGEQA